MKHLSAAVLMIALSTSLFVGCTESEDEAAPAPNPVLDLPLDETIALPQLPSATDVAFDSLGMLHREA